MEDGEQIKVASKPKCISLSNIEFTVRIKFCILKNTPVFCKAQGYGVGFMKRYIIKHIMLFTPSLKSEYVDENSLLICGVGTGGEACLNSRLVLT